MTKKNPNVLISQEANLDLEIMVEKSNAGFQGGKITRSDVVSFAIRQFQSRYFEENLSVLRANHFDETAFLAAVLKERKNASKAGQAPQDLSKILKQLAVRAYPGVEEEGK